MDDPEDRADAFLRMFTDAQQDVLEAFAAVADEDGEHVARVDPLPHLP
jgi:hypothetical protein